MSSFIRYTQGGKSMAATLAPRSRRTGTGQVHSNWVGGGITIAGGNSVQTISGFKYHVFTSSGTLTVTGSGEINVLAIGGGGGGQASTGGRGGGGGGAIVYQPITIGGNVSVTIGQGGPASDSNTGNGGNTVLSGGVSLTALGGGHGNGGGVLNVNGSGGAFGYGTPPQGRNGATVGVGSGIPGGGYGATANVSGAGYSAGWTIDAATAQLSVFSGMTELAGGGRGGANANHGGTTGQNGGGLGCFPGGYVSTQSSVYGCGGGGSGTNGHHPSSGAAGTQGVVVFRTVA
jgi:hypothetical protein